MSNEPDTKTDSSLPREGSVLYSWIKGDAGKRKRSLGRWSSVNKYLVVPLYRVGLLPLLGFGKLFLLLYTLGRRSGKQRITPLEYRRRNGDIYIVSGRGRRSDWFRNLKASPDKISVRVGFKNFEPKITIINDKEKERFLSWYVSKHPRAANLLFGWDPDNDTIHNSDFSELVQLIEIIRLQLGI
jgi:deazaflavin-dependent oxidoreductase (nitroreductase family)